MGLFELETIEPPNAGRTGRSLSAKELKGIEDAAFADGYKAGVDAANAGIAAEQNRFLAAINEALADQRFDFDQANARAHGALCDLVTAISEILAPGIAQSHFEDVVLARVSAAARAKLDGALALFVAPEAQDSIGALLDGTATQASISADADLSGLQARLEWAGGADHLDLEGALGEIQSMLGDYVNTIRELSDERHRSSG